LATIRDKGLCPCPRCLISKSKLDKLGLRRDILVRIKKPRKFMADMVESARKAIYNLANPIDGAAVNRLLKDFSGVPTEVLFQVLNIVISNEIIVRMLFLIALEKILQTCWW
jgi:hypothetical protein